MQPLGHGDVRFFDGVALAYDLLMPPTDVAPLREAFARAERPVRRVLDVGGGTGRASRAIRRLGADPVVVDYSAGMLRRARARGLAALRADAARLPVRDGSVDAVVVVDALHHVPDRGGALREAARVLAPGGVLVVREFDPGTLRGRGLVALESLVGMESTFSGPADLVRAATELGLTAGTLETGFEFTVYGVKPGGPGAE